MNTTQNFLDLFWNLKNGMIATLGRYFFDAFLPKICAKWPVSTIFIPSAEALARRGRWRKMSVARQGLAWPVNQVKPDQQMAIKPN
ncbi:hypothetical protein [Aquaspirillum sp. LM1]|uniref:hypothetical protein n=1 Tax=Aquaspirillum sp. LM1 TaxID=1938604 RepID=UPI0012378DA2|nr:hypothetical protein [Aquaspirillum sp. LM1]